MRFLTTFWPALVVTLGAALCAYQFPDGLIDLAAVIVAGLVWGAVVLLDRREPPIAPVAVKAPDEGQDQAIQQSVYLIVQRVNLFIDEEVKILNESLKQIQDLAKDAVATLGGSMQSLNHQVRSQSRLLHQLAGVAQAEADAPAATDSVSWAKYIEDSQSVITYFIRLLDDVENQRKDVEGALKEILQQSARARDALETLPPGASKDVRLSVTRLRSLVQRQVQGLGEAPRMSRERSDAAEAMDRIRAARDELQQMRDIVMMNVEAFSRQSHQDVGRAIQSLQFEDIVTQLVTGAQGRLDEMNQLVGSLSQRVDRLKLVNDAQEPIGVLKVVEEIEMDVVKYTERLRASRSRPVGQSNLDEGSVELF